MVSNPLLFNKTVSPLRFRLIFWHWRLLRGQLIMDNLNATASDATMPILNPNTPLAFLTPEQAYQTSVSTYVLVASLGVSFLSMILSRENDLKFWNRYCCGMFLTMCRTTFLLCSEVPSRSAPLLLLAPGMHSVPSIIFLYIMLIILQTWVAGICNRCRYF